MNGGDIKLTFDDDFLLDSAQKRYEEGDYFGALRILNKREFRNAPLADAYELYAEIYDALGLWQGCVDAWFRFLDTCAREEFYEGFEGLAAAYLNMGNELRSTFYYGLALTFNEDAPELPEETPSRPALHLVHDADEAETSPEMLAEGLALLKAGQLEEARDVFSDIPERSTDYPSGAGLAAMCSLMLGEEEEAECTSLRLMEQYPENVQVLTTYCAVLGATDKKEEARRVAKKLYELPATATDDLYRVATALCETGLDAEAKERLEDLMKALPYDENVLWFHAVAAYHVRDIDAAIQSLETLTTLRPRKAVAKWYLARLREAKETGEPVPLTYYYRLPEEQYRVLASELLEYSRTNTAPGPPEERDTFSDNFRLAFDEMEGHDEKLQLLAAKVALHARADALIREVLLDSEGNDIVKLSILHDLVCRNEEESYGVVLCDLYREMFLCRLDIGERGSEQFLTAFADVYAKFAIFGESNAEKLCSAAEDLYDTVARYGAWECFARRSEIAAVIYREARLKHGVRSLKEICELFGADERITQQILNLMM